MAQVCHVVAGTEVEGPGRSGPVEGGLADVAPPSCAIERWDEVVEHHELTTAAVIAEALASQDDMWASTRRNVAFVCGSAAMALWLGAMPLTSANLWCAELHGFATLVQFDVVPPEEGPRMWTRSRQETYADAIEGAIRGIVDVEFAAALDRLHLPERVAAMGRDPGVARMAFALAAILYPYGWDRAARRRLPGPPGSRI